MSPSVAAPVPRAALRVMRAAAGRRVLQLALLVGALFALGLLCGQQAQAADGTDGVDGTPSARTGVIRPVGGEAVRPVGDVVDGVVNGVVGGAVSGVVDGVATGDLAGTIGTVGEVVETVTGELADVSAQLPQLPQIPPIAEQPSVPSLPTVPSLPSLPGLPGLPATPELPSLPGASAAGDTLPASVPPVSVQDGDAAPDQDGRQADDDAAAAVTVRPAAETYGPTYAGTDVITGSAHSGSYGGGQGVRAVAPPEQAPAGDPTGLLGNRSAVDGGAPRHGDSQAVAPHHRVSMRLVPGAAAVLIAAGTRDRHRDILKFPG
ncbi:hypothetical protein [Streptomyces sp. NPDC059786]|uniref:hypothetical protein n=1 Tax=Streptomyces sp. NPDC059786 TaxID=3346946 RepID=UPI003661A6A0